MPLRPEQVGAAVAWVWARAPVALAYPDTRVTEVLAGMNDLGLMTVAASAYSENGGTLPSDARMLLS